MTLRELIPILEDGCLVTIFYKQMTLYRGNNPKLYLEKMPKRQKYQYDLPIKYIWASRIMNDCLCIELLD